MKDTIVTIGGCVLFMAALPWVLKVFAFYFDYFVMVLKS